jgi:hypothetical protein
MQCVREIEMHQANQQNLSQSLPNHVSSEDQLFMCLPVHNPGQAHMMEQQLDSLSNAMTDMCVEEVKFRKVFKQEIIQHSRIHQIQAICPPILTARPLRGVTLYILQLLQHFHFNLSFKTHISSKCSTNSILSNNNNG